MPKPIQCVKFTKAFARHTKIRDLKKHFIQTHCTIPIPVEFDRLMSVSSGSGADVDMRVSSKRGIVEVESETVMGVCLDGTYGPASGCE